MDDFRRVQNKVINRLTKELQEACGYWMKGKCYSESFICELAFYNALINEAYYAEDMLNISDSLARVFKEEMDK